MGVNRWSDDVAEVEIAGEGERGEFDLARRAERAADALRARGVDDEQALAVIEFQFARRACDGFGGAIDERSQVDGRDAAGCVRVFHLGAAGVVRVHDGMGILFRLARFGGVEAERAAVDIGVARADGPRGVIALVMALEVTVAIHEIAGGIAEFFQRAEDLGAGGGPIAGLNEPLEPELAEEGIRASVKPSLHLEEKHRSLLISRGFLSGHRPS